MNATTRRTRALQILAATGMWQSSYEPPLLRLLWRLGFDIPPPHFSGFVSTAAFTGTLFGVFWGLLMWLLVWSANGMPLILVALLSAITGLLFGLAMASYYAYGRHKHKLPTWQELVTQPGGA